MRDESLSLYRLVVYERLREGGPTFPERKKDELLFLPHLWCTHTLRYVQYPPPSLIINIDPGCDRPSSLSLTSGPRARVGMCIWMCAPILVCESMCVYLVLKNAKT